MNDLSRSIQARKLEQKPPTECTSVIEFLSRQLGDTGFSFYRLYLPIELEDGTSVSYNGTPSVFWEGEGAREVTATMMTHPDKGILLVDDASFFRGRPYPAAEIDLGSAYSTLLRHRITLGSYLSECETVDWSDMILGAVVIAAVEPEKALDISSEVPRQCVVTNADIDDFPECLDSAFEFDSQPVSASKLNEVIKALEAYPKGCLRPDEWFMNIHKSVDHDLAVLEDIWDNKDSHR